MNKKILIALFGIGVVGIAILLFVFRSDDSIVVDAPVVAENCLVFQSEDSNRPCFLASNPVQESPAPTASEVECPQNSLFERNDCITKLAEERQDKGLCDSVQGDLARNVCLQGSVDSGPSVVAPSVKNTYESFVRGYVSSAPVSGTTSSSVVRSDGVTTQTGESADRSSEASAEGFYARSAAGGTLALYTVFPYQNRPGDLVRVQGMGFALDATNTVHVGGSSVSAVSSADGMNLSFTLPALSSGNYEVWVTNARGTTQASERPIYLVVSDNPVPAPRITTVSPSNPTYEDVITLSGDNLLGIKGVYTTLGQVKSGSLSFRISDLEYAHLVLEDPSVKGMSVPLYVYVVAEGGLSEQPFIFDVQY